MLICWTNLLSHFLTIFTYCQVLFQGIDGKLWKVSNTKMINTLMGIISIDRILILKEMPFSFQTKKKKVKLYWRDISRQLFHKMFTSPLKILTCTLLKIEFYALEFMLLDMICTTCLMFSPMLTQSHLLQSYWGRGEDG